MSKLNPDRAYKRWLKRYTRKRAIRKGFGVYKFTSREIVVTFSKGTPLEVEK